MATEYSTDELLEFLNHASQRGLMPAATAQALAVASRRVFEMLSKDEREDLRRVNVDATVKRFGTKHAKDFNPSSLKEYGRRAHRAVELFLRWRSDPALFSVKTRATALSRRKEKVAAAAPNSEITLSAENNPPFALGPGPTSGYQSSFPIRPGTVITIMNIPTDLSKFEADRLAQFIKMLAVETGA
jgi:hypothetical protein